MLIHEDNLLPIFLHFKRKNLIGFTLPYSCLPACIAHSRQNIWSGLISTYLKCIVGYSQYLWQQHNIRMIYFVTAVQRGPSSSSPSLIRAACQCAPLCRSMRVCVGVFIFSKRRLHGAELSRSNSRVSGSWTLGKLQAAASRQGEEAPSVCWARRLHRTCAGKSTIILSLLDAFHYLGLNDVIPYCAKATTDASFVGVISLS